MQDGSQIDDLGSWTPGWGFGGRSLTAKFDLLVYELEHGVPIVIRVFIRVPIAGHAIDKLGGH